MRTILDVWQEGSLPKPVLRTAFREAMKRGAITKSQAGMPQQDADRTRMLAEIRKGTE